MAESANGASRIREGGVTMILLGALLGGALSLGGWSLIMAVDHESRISVIESHQFTDTEAERLKGEVLSAIRDVKECVIKHQAEQPCQ